MTNTAKYQLTVSVHFYIKMIIPVKMIQGNEPTKGIWVTVTPGPEETQMTEFLSVKQVEKRIVSLCFLMVQFLNGTVSQWQRLTVP